MHAAAMDIVRDSISGYLKMTLHHDNGSLLWEPLLLFGSGFCPASFLCYRANSQRPNNKCVRLAKVCWPRRTAQRPVSIPNGLFSSLKRLNVILVVF